MSARTVTWRSATGRGARRTSPSGSDRPARFACAPAAVPWIPATRHPGQEADVRHAERPAGVQRLRLPALALTQRRLAAASADARIGEEDDIVGRRGRHVAARVGGAPGIERALIGDGRLLDRGSRDGARIRRLGGLRPRAAGAARVAAGGDQRDQQPDDDQQRGGERDRRAGDDRRSSCRRVLGELVQRGPDVAVVAGDRGVAARHVAAGLAGRQPVLDASEAQADLAAAAWPVDPVGAAVAALGGLQAADQADLVVRQPERVLEVAQLLDATAGRRASCWPSAAAAGRTRCRSRRGAG